MLRVGLGQASSRAEHRCAQCQQNGNRHGKCSPTRGADLKEGPVGNEHCYRILTFPVILVSAAGGRICDVRRKRAEVPGWKPWRQTIGPTTWMMDGLGGLFSAQEVVFNCLYRQCVCFSTDS